MTSQHIKALILAIIILFSVSCGRPLTRTEEQILKGAVEILILFTSDEGTRLNVGRMNHEAWRDYQNQYLMATRQVSDGPAVTIEKPKVEKVGGGISEIKTVSPATLRISFQENPRSKTPVNMESLEVKAKKFAFTKDLTKKLRQYIRGTTLEAANVEMPTGKFHIEISIADTKGNKTVENYVFVIGG